MNTLLDIAHTIPVRSKPIKIKQRPIPLDAIGATAVGNAVILTPEEHEHEDTRQIARTPYDRYQALLQRVRVDAIELPEFLRLVDRHIGLGHSIEIETMIRDFRRT